MRSLSLTNARNEHRLRPRLGAVTVEFALCVPLAFMLTFGLVEFSRANMLRNTAENAAYEGARAGIVPGASATSATAAANKIMTAIGARSVTVSVNPTTITDTTPSVTVTVSIPVSSNLWATPAFFTNESITRSCTLTRERTTQSL